MPSSLESVIERVMGELHRIVRTETVVGDPVQAGELTLIPVSKISFGFGAGGGQEGKGQSGTGGGATVEPIAFLVIDGTGNVEIMPLRENSDSGGLGQLLELMPEALAKIKTFVDKKKQQRSEEGKT
ncbi:MAG: sporulation protein [Candidatus Latescibacteria bacterium]|nr:sporulation protein [Candidatus Latescibacterota bacterium]